MVYFLLIVAGLVAGFVDTIAGGGGLITLPAYLMAGLPPHTAIGTNKISSVLSAANAARIFLKKRIFSARYWITAMVAAFSGGVIGAVTVHFLSAIFLKQFLPVVMIGLAVYVAVPKKYGHLRESHEPPKKISSSLLGVLLGFYDGFLGPGTGSFWVVALMAIYKIPLLEATAVAKLLNCLSGIAALCVFIIFGSVQYGLGLIVAAATMTGAYLGAHSTLRWGTPFIRPLFLIIVVCVAVILAYQNA